MTAGTDLSPQLYSRFFRLGDLLIAGWAALLAVAFAGLTLGFFGWYAVIVPRHHGVVSELGLLVCTLGGVALTLAAWTAYARYFSHRAGITLVRSLQYDALTWPPFLLLWFTFVLAAQLTHGARLFLLALGLCCVGKVLIAARFNQTVREVSIDFAATRIAITSSSPNSPAVIIRATSRQSRPESSHMLLAVWGRWDASSLSEHRDAGHYQGTDMAFFPLGTSAPDPHRSGTLAGNHLIAKDC